MDRGNFYSDSFDKSVAAVFEAAREFAASDAPLLITGPFGAGKSALARAVAAWHPTRTGTVLILNCSALTAEAQERELFTEKLPRPTSTLIIDEIEDLAPNLQERLADELGRAAESRARVVATSSKNILTKTEAGAFSERLAEILSRRTITLPTLAQRSRDIPGIADHFLAELGARHDRSVAFSPEVYHFLCRRKWEGNLHELKNVVTRLYYSCENNLLTAADYTRAEGGHWLVDENLSSVATPPYLPLEEVEKRYILHTMRLTKGNKSQAARTLHISLKTLRHKLKTYADGISELPSASLPSSSD